MSIGREPANGIRVDDDSVSRRHCLIKRDNGSFRVVDLESYNGTFVNGVPVGEQALHHGDQVAVGKIVFLFLLDETEAVATENAVELNDEELSNFSTVRLEGKDALYLKPAAVVAALLPPLLSPPQAAATSVRPTNSAPARRTRDFCMLFVLPLFRRGGVAPALWV